MKRTNLLLGVLLVGQLTFFGLVYAFCGSPSGTQAARQLLLAGVKREAVQKITIADNDGKKVILAPRGDKWVLPERADHPADTKKVDRVLGQLLGLESVYLVSRSPAHHNEFEVAAHKFRRRVTLEGKEGLQKQIFVGKSGSSGFTNVRLASGPEVYAVEDLKYWELGTRVADWAQKKVVTRTASGWLAWTSPRAASTTCWNAPPWPVGSWPASPSRSPRVTSWPARPCSST